jgi:hypothetical protein
MLGRGIGRARVAVGAVEVCGMTGGVMVAFGTIRVMGPGGGVITVSVGATTV